MVGKKEPEGKMVFKSPNTGEYVSQHQYLAEIMVKRHAEKKGVVLTYKYWNKKDNFWAEEFKKQVTEAGKLLRKYSIRAIMNSLNEVKWVYSLRTKKLVDEIKRQQETLDKLEKKSTIENISEDTTSFRQSFVNKGILGKNL